MHGVHFAAGYDIRDPGAERFGIGQVFKDVDSIEPGDDFAEVIAGAAGSCDVLLALIGDRWLTITDAAGRRRLDDPGDFVRLEIETALTRNIRVVPILVEGRGCPAPTSCRPASPSSRSVRPSNSARTGSTPISADSSGCWTTPRPQAPDPKAPGSLAGDVLIDSDGGPARIHVTAIADLPAATTAPRVPRAPSGNRGYYQGYKLATWLDRVAAQLTDWIPLAPGIVVWYIGNQKHLWFLVLIGVLTTFPIWFYNRWYRQGKTGHSWGKQAMGLGLIRMSDTKPISVWEAAARDLTSRELRLDE